MNSIKHLLLLSAIFLFQASIAQTTTNTALYKRVSISNPTPAQINTLHQIGIDLCCGAIYKNNHLEVELSTHEMLNLDQQEINYTVLVDDLSAFYESNASNLPRAREELELLKSNTRNDNKNLLANLLANDDCEEIDWSVPNNFNLNPNAAPNSFGGCLTYDQVLQELDDMRAQYPNLISQKLDASSSNQTTIEGRTIHYVRISDNPDLDEADEPETLYQSLVHSREPSSLMQLLYYMWYILENYESDPDIQNLVNNQALYFIPVFNPDGFVHNEMESPNGGGMQRKNRNVTTACPQFLDGIDLNRNSAYYWGNGGASTDGCSNTFLGDSPFSENETQIMRDFFLEHDFKLALNHHSYKNAMLHAYAGVEITNPRPDEYSKYNHDMTEYNRYAYGPSTSISYLNSGNMNDWMLGGPAGISSNGTPTGTGSGKHTMAWTPENGSFQEGGFWPDPSYYVLIAQRAMRMNFLAAFYSGKFAKLHDLNQSEINTTTGTLTFGIENLGQTPSDFEVSVTPITPNILSVSDPMSISGMNVLDQESVTFNYSLDPNVIDNDTIKFLVTLSNDYSSDNILTSYEITKVFQPNMIFSDNPDNDNLSNWTFSGGEWFITSDAYTGTSAITSTINPPYVNNESKTLTLNEVLDFSGNDPILIQYYGKWDLERSFDYVQIEASVDDLFWTPLCGKLTKVAAPDINNTYSGKSFSENNFQPDGTELYDGDTQGKWNMEEIIIDENSNSFLFDASTVYLRFNFKTDGSNSQDAYYSADFEGFTFDDFKCMLLAQPLPTSTDDLSQNDFKVYPNPVTSQLSIELGSDTFDEQISIVDVYGRLIYLQDGLVANSLTVDTKDWSPGVYFVHAQGLGVKKVVKQ